MKKITLKKAVFTTTLLLTSFLYAQEPAKTFGKKVPGNNVPYCASAEYLKLQQSGNTRRPTDKEFEEWMAPKVVAFKREQLTKDSGTPNVLTLPVVFHIVHNGDEVGENENIPDERVFSQIEVLNNDYRRVMGTLGYNENTPGVDTEIQFCLAQRDPDGNATNGIDRIELEQETWDVWENLGLESDIETQLKPQTQWDPEKYINVWVVKFTTGFGGYAYLPSGSGLEGIESSNNAVGDGIVVSHTVVGSSDTFPDPSYPPGWDKGRLLTHEIGHFLGLRHVWGDVDDCTSGDYCDDTPIAFTINYGCETIDSCPDDPGNDMIENYMDSTSDLCKSVFTNDQKARMHVVLQNAVRRKLLVTANSCSSTAGINENSLHGINIYPNPVSNILYIASNIEGTTGSYEIYNTLGQLVAADTIRFQNGLSIDTSALSQGVYNIKITCENKTKALKFVKK